MGNSWYCSKCEKHTDAKKTQCFWAAQLPEVLVFVLKRFEFRDMSEMGRGTVRQKVDTFVDFPLEGLNMAPFCGDISSLSPVPADGECQEGKVRGEELLTAYCGEHNPRTMYDLFAVCNHYGQLGSGHYTACARDWRGDGMASTWNSFDDDDVEPCSSDSEVVSRAAYMLFYRRRP